MSEQRLSTEQAERQMTRRAHEAGAFEASALKRPDRALLTYYIWISLLALPLFPFVFLPHYLKYRTLRYRFDDEGVSIAWGVLFRREITLTYRRIQDIHVKENLFHRWLDIAALEIQTASGAAGAEMTIEGVREPDRLRDFLYLRMRGARGEDEPGARATDQQHAEDTASHADGRPDELLETLVDVRDALAQTRAALEKLAPTAPDAPHAAPDEEPRA